MRPATSSSDQSGRRPPSLKTVTAALSPGAGALLLVGCSSASQPAAQSAQTAQPAMTSTPGPSGPPGQHQRGDGFHRGLCGSRVVGRREKRQGAKDPAGLGRARRGARDSDRGSRALITLHGTGPNDLTLTQQADWKRWACAMSGAGLAAFTASEKKDIKAVVAANSQLVEARDKCDK